MRNSYTMDQDMRLEDGVTDLTTAGGADTGQVDLADSILDIGGAGGAYVKFDLVIDVVTIDFGATDETYDIHFQLSASATFASGVIERCALLLGDARTGGPVDDMIIPGRFVFGLDNEAAGTLYRYGRCFALAAGTTGILNYKAFLSRI